MVFIEKIGKQLYSGVVLFVFHNLRPLVREKKDDRLTKDTREFISLPFLTKAANKKSSSRQV